MKNNGKKATKNAAPVKPVSAPENETDKMQHGTVFRASMSRKGISTATQVVTPCGVMSFGMALDWDHDK